MHFSAELNKCCNSQNKAQHYVHTFGQTHLSNGSTLRPSVKVFLECKVSGCYCSRGCCTRGSGFLPSQLFPAPYLAAFGGIVGGLLGCRSLPSWHHESANAPITHTGLDADTSSSYRRQKPGTSPTAQPCVYVPLFNYLTTPGGFIVFEPKMNGVTRSLCTIEDIRNQEHVSYSFSFTNIFQFHFFFMFEGLLLD